MTTPRPETCPNCTRNGVLEIVYGLVDWSDNWASARVTLGGCVIEPDSPGWKCRYCSHTWGVVDDADWSPVSRT